MSESSVQTRRPPKHIPRIKKGLIKDLLMQWKSVREIATSLDVSIGSVAKIRDEIKGNLQPTRPGPQPKISARTLRFVAREYNTGGMESFREAQKYIRKQDGVDVQVETIRRHLRERGVKAHVKQKRCDLLEHHAHARYQFAKDHKNWTVDDWKKVMFSDETVVSRVGSFGRQYYYSDAEHMQNQPHQIRRVAQGGGGKMMIWGCLTYNSPGDLSWAPEGMDSELYLRMLRDYVTASFKWSGMNPAESYFQHDNSSVHNANIVRGWLAMQKFTVLKWPAKSPDLNIIEIVWSYVKQHLSQFDEDPEDLDELWRRVQEIWTNLPHDYIHRLYESMPDRISAALHSKGWYTKY